MSNKAVNLIKAAEALGCSHSFAAALKKGAGIKGRLFDLGVMRRWWRDHPDFKCTDAYPRASTNRVRAVA